MLEILSCEEVFDNTLQLSSKAKKISTVAIQFQILSRLAWC